ncbi:HipA family kinase [Halalkalibacter okhensis]|uniref:HipA-like kinase domain-containing protein n=1 Tax=Halalkalibacter okhensis TaxID=333138 RepID=A0A0B0IPL5_9BACI|nr:HipA family kinase [Halalkalibacter okhensis]KHF41621.1 hypothetical protein LQ50_02650 [Halalkalibacter okhensis]
MTTSKNTTDEVIHPVKYVETLRGGTAHVILFSDGKKYVVKWFGVKKARGKEVVNEYVVSKLAQLLSLPIVPFKLVYIPEDFLKNTPQLHKKKQSYHSGIHYACVFIENSTVFENVRQSLPSKTEVKNRDMLAGVTVFDQWLNNSDRGTMNVILERLSDERYYVHMIDHGRCFPGGYQWTSKTLMNEPVYTYHWPFYKWVYSLLHDAQELTSYIDNIVDLPNESIYEVIQSIPNEWNVDTEDKEALYQFLLKQKKDLPNIINTIIEYQGQ